MPFSPVYVVILAIVISILVLVIQFGILHIAFDKLGLSPESATLLLFASFGGSLINVPLFKIKAEQTEPIQIPPFLRGLLKQPIRAFEGYTIVSVNLGGCLLPMTLAVYLIIHSDVSLLATIVGVTAMSLVAYAFSRPIHGLGIGMPMFVAPFAAAIIGLIIEPDNSAPLAYISGTLGVLIGADILRIKDIRRLGTPIASIGGAGTFDGIFITGIIAALLT